MTEITAHTLSTETKHYKDQVVMVTCHGWLVVGTEDGLYDTVRPLLLENKRVILELADLHHTDSRGLGTLVRLYVAARSAGCSLELMHLSKQIRYLLGLTNLFDVFTVICEKGVKLM